MYAKRKAPPLVAKQYYRGKPIVCDDAFSILMGLNEKPALEAEICIPVVLFRFGKYTTLFILNYFYFINNKF